jgi:CDP-paratose 2-epimerase
MKYLITGGCGFIGSNLAAEVLARGEELVVLDNLFRFGSSSNLEWLKLKGEFTYYPLDIRNINDVETVIKNEKPNVVFHLAGQVAMTTSISNPRLDFEINALGTFNILDSIRKFAPEAMILYSSSNKVYGDFEKLNFIEKENRYECVEYPDGFDENIPLDFHSPYGCSKGAADQYLLDFNRIFGIKTVVFRHSSMYGGNQHSTIDQGWIGWFCQKALDIKNKTNKEKLTISGSGKQVRDVLHAKDVVSLYFTCTDKIDKVKGKSFNIGGGIKNSLSLLELFHFLEKELDVEMNFERLPERESDQLVFVANNSKITNFTGWEPNINTSVGLMEMIDWLSKQNN